MIHHFALRPQKRGGLLGTGTRERRGRKSEGSTADTARKRPERPWTAARTMEVLRRYPFAITQRLVRCAIAVLTAVLGQSHKDNVRCTAVEGQPEAKEVQLSQPSSISLLMISSGLRVQLHLPPLDLTWNPVGVCVREDTRPRLTLISGPCYRSQTPGSTLHVTTSSQPALQEAVTRGGQRPVYTESITQKTR